MLTNQPLLVISSAQAGPLLQPYVSSHQISGLVNGLADAAKYEYKNNISLGVAFLLGCVRCWNVDGHRVDHRR